MLSIKEVAKELNVSTRTIHRYIKNGIIKVVKIDKLIRIHPDELKRLKGE